MLFLVSTPARASGVEVDLLCRKTVVWNSSTMPSCTAEVVAFVWIVAEVVHTVADCS